MKLGEIKVIKGEITLISGLHIGAGDTEMHIGGTDNPVVKHPYTLEPYIPGSSLKGKIRSLLEMRSGLMGKTNGKPVREGDLKDLVGYQQDECKKILKLFGASGADTAQQDGLGPTRAVFSDCFLSDVSRNELRERRQSATEVKAENTINRITGTAENPRFTERVVSGLKFDFSVFLKILETGDEGLESFLLEGFKLLEMDYLGGSGSRGYGRVKFEFEDNQLQQKFSGTKPFVGNQPTA